MPPAEILEEIDAKVDAVQLETVLMKEGIEKFANPQRALLALISQKRAAITTAH